MAAGPSRSISSTSWQRPLVLAGACAAVGVAVHLAGARLPVPLTALGLGIGLIGASFMLAWAADAGEAVFAGGLVLAAVALVGVLPEYIIEVHFAFTQQAGLVTANLTGATRILLTGAVGVPLVVALLASRTHGVPAPIDISPHRRLELGMLLVSAIFAVQIVARASLTVFDGIILLGLYVVYAMRIQGTPDEEPAVVGVGAGLLTLPQRYRRAAIGGLIVVAAAVVVEIAIPFTDALLLTGAQLGFDPYLLVQSVVPLTTEAPELVVVAVLVANRRPAQGLAVFLASSVSQWTLGLGSLPIAYLAGGGGIAMPLAGREQIELGFTAAVTLFAVAALATLHPERVDAFLMAGVYLVQLIYPAPFVRLGCTFVLLVFAIDLLLARHRAVRPLLRAALGRQKKPRAP
jgi:cation:H+ antiporter